MSVESIPQRRSEWSVQATGRGLVVGAAAGVVGGAVYSGALRLFGGPSLHGASMGAWVAGGAIAGAMLGAAGRTHHDPPVGASVRNAIFVAGSLVSAAVMAPRVAAAATALGRGQFRQAAAGMASAGGHGLAAFAAMTAACALAVPLGMPQHFSVARRPNQP